MMNSRKRFKHKQLDILLLIQIWYKTKQLRYMLAAVLEINK